MAHDAAKHDAAKYLADIGSHARIGSMPDIARTTVSLRITGDTLDPEEITRLLGIEPTRCTRKGDVRRIASGREMIAQVGSWVLSADTPDGLDAGIGALLGKLPNDPAVWRDLNESYRCDMFCGLFMQDSNEGAELQPQVLSMLGDRGLRLGLDIYCCPD